jgi:hypothetical protein
MVSISPVPKLEPGPVSYIQLDDGALPAAPLKSSLKTVDHPDGGPGTAAVAAVAAGAAVARPAAGVRAAAEAEGPEAAVSATIQPTAAPSAISRRARRRDQFLAAGKALRACRSKPVMGRILHRQRD